MEKLLRDWRQDAVNRHQYESAIYIGDKLLALTGDPQDAFWLAQVHFSTGNYTRAQSFLARHDLLAHSPACRYLAAHCKIKQQRYDEALALLGEENPTHLIAHAKGRRKLHHHHHAVNSGGNVAAGQQRNGVARSRGGGIAGGGDGHPRRERMEKSEEREHEDASNLKFEAAMCYLRGLCYAKQNAFDRAKQCYQDAVRIDVQCFEAFDQLMKNCLLSPQEEWDFLESLDFDAIPVPGARDESAVQETAAFVRMLYTTRLSKYKNPAEFGAAIDTLSTHYRLSANHDIVLAKADLLFTQCRFAAALELTASVLDSDPYNFAAYPTHLACLHELGYTHTLFLLAHRLADSHPDEPCTWLAVGIYYLSTQKIAEARRYFSKASMMDPHFGPAWIGFAHTFAAEGEHDQAISAYSTASRLFQGTHLPTLYLGMQNLQLNNLSLAQEYLHEAARMCPTDPLLLNELGVVMYHLDQPDAAADMFRQALAAADVVRAEPRAWIGTRTNLGHALRRRGHFEDALQQFDDVLRLGGRDAPAFCAKGLVLLELARPWDAVCAFHEALAVQSQDPIATDLLGRALEEMAVSSGGQGQGRSQAPGATSSFASTDSRGQSTTEFGALGGMDALGRRADGLGSGLGHREVDEVIRAQYGGATDQGGVKGRGGRRARRMAQLQEAAAADGTKWGDGTEGGDARGTPRGDAANNGAGPPPRPAHQQLQTPAAAAGGEVGEETSMMELSDDD